MTSKEFEVRPGSVPVGHSGDDEERSSLPPGFNPNMADAPRDTPILGWCNHKADPYWLDERYLTTYGAHVEGLGHVEDGPHVLEWGGEYDDDDGSIPAWWFRGGSDWEEAANPIGWIAIPTNTPTPAGSDHEERPNDR